MNDRDEARPGESTQTELHVVYGSAENRMGALALAESLSSIASVVGEINEGLGSSTNIEVQVAALEHGSIDIWLIFAEKILPGLVGLLGPQELSSAKAAADVFVGVLRVLLHVGNAKPKEVEFSGGNVNITNCDNLTITVNNNVYHAYSNPSIANQFGRNFLALENSPSVSDFSVKGQDGQVYFTVGRDGFGRMIGSGANPTETKTVVVPRTEVGLVQLDFTGKYMWRVQYAGNVVRTKITDEGFLKRVASRQDHFAFGDILVVDLQYTNLISSNTGLPSSKDHEIIKVHAHRNAFAKNLWLDGLNPAEG